MGKGGKGKGGGGGYGGSYGGGSGGGSRGNDWGDWKEGGGSSWKDQRVQQTKADGDDNWRGGGGAAAGPASFSNGGSRNDLDPADRNSHASRDNGSGWREGAGDGNQVERPPRAAKGDRDRGKGKSKGYAEGAGGEGAGGDWYAEGADGSKGKGKRNRNRGKGGKGGDSAEGWDGEGVEAADQAERPSRGESRAEEPEAVAPKFEAASPKAEAAVEPAAPTNGNGDHSAAAPTMAFASQDVRYQTQDVRYQAAPAAAEAPAGGFACQDVRYSQDARYDNKGAAATKEKAPRNRGGKNKEKGGKGGGKGEGRGKGAQEQAAVPGDWEEGEQNDGEDPASYVEKAIIVAPPKNPVQQALNSKVRKVLTDYEASLDIEDLGKAVGAIEASIEKGEGMCDTATLTLVLVSLTRVNKLANAHKMIDAAVSEKVHLEPAGIVGIATAVSQRSQSHKALRYLRRLIYECLPEDFNQEMVLFFDRHVSFIFSELMAEADGCFGRMENRDPNALVNLGHAELDVQLDWEKSTGQSFVLFNRADDKGKKVYVPTVFGGGFQRTDSALMSFDISNPAVQEVVPRDYDRIRDGAEVEVFNSASGPQNQAPLSVKLTSAPKVPFRPGMFYRLDRLASRDQTRRMLEALKVVLKQPIDLIPYQVKQGGDQSAASLLPHRDLRELVLVPHETTLAKAGKAELPLRAMDFGGSKARLASHAIFAEESKHAYAHTCNASQLEALTLACTLRLTLIQGPPGTGKTTTAVQIVAALVQYGLVDLPMLVTADSNTAVDNLVKGIGKRGLSVVRVGRPESIREDVKQYALDGQWKLLKKAEVVCATCIGASGTTLDKIRFATVLIDECTQAAESAALVPMARGCQQAILIGDQCQLPPTVLSDVAETENLGESLFTRLVTQGVRPVLLDTQYRMHPLIAEFASAAFYNGRLQNGVSHIHRKPPDGFPWPQRQMPVAFVNLEKGEEKREGSSYINPAEAEKTLWSLLEVCKNDTLGPDDVGIVTPYKGQVNFIKKLIRERPGLARFRTGLEVESVDGFQGQEKEVIIFCAVRNNREGKVGFLSDWRRLNVMLTRARRGVIVIGSRSTLVQDPLWKEWLLWATARGAICGEGAKGTWVPKYLVDDRDGVWTMKSMDDGKGFGGSSAQMTAGKPSIDTGPTEVMDSWEDIGSPVMSPVNQARDGPVSDDILADDILAEEPEPTMTRAQELRAERNREEEEEAKERLSRAGGGQAASAAVDRPPPGTPEPKLRARPERIGDDYKDEDMRKSGSPVLGPGSPQRALALAKLGLLDDVEAEDLARPSR